MCANVVNLYVLPENLCSDNDEEEDEDERREEKIGEEKQRKRMRSSMSERVGRGARKPFPD